MGEGIENDEEVIFMKPASICLFLKSRFRIGLHDDDTTNAPRFTNDTYFIFQRLPRARLVNCQYV